MLHPNIENKSLGNSVSQQYFKVTEYLYRQVQLNVHFNIAITGLRDYLQKYTAAMPGFSPAGQSDVMRIPLQAKQAAFWNKTNRTR